MWKSTEVTLGDTEATKQACFTLIINPLAPEFSFKF
jgi:hypothetical protein